MDAKSPEELQSLLKEAHEIREELQASQTALRDSLKADKDRLQALLELYHSRKWTPTLSLNSEDLFSVMQCVQYVLGVFLIESAEQAAEKIRQRAEV
ncbi:MAG TPA: hypothetical protein VNQ76_04685 [Planctomicrobium sp.]|nr:hypothetical protein [Planctomicrobium sp.]